MEDFYSDTVSSFSLLNSDLKKKWGRGTSVNRALGGAGEGAASSIAPKSASFQCPLVAAARRCILGPPWHRRWPRGKAEPQGHGERDSPPHVGSSRVLFRDSEIHGCVQAVVYLGIFSEHPSSLPGWELGLHTSQSSDFPILLNLLTFKIKPLFHLLSASSTKEPKPSALIPS